MFTSEWEHSALMQSFTLPLLGFTSAFNTTLSRLEATVTLVQLQLMFNHYITNINKYKCEKVSDTLEYFSRSKPRIKSLIDK